MHVHTGGGVALAWLSLARARTLVLCESSFGIAAAIAGHVVIGPSRSPNSRGTIGGLRADPFVVFPCTLGDGWWWARRYGEFDDGEAACAPRHLSGLRRLSDAAMKAGYGGVL